MLKKEKKTKIMKFLGKIEVSEESNSSTQNNSSVQNNSSGSSAQNKQKKIII